MSCCDHLRTQSWRFEFIQGREERFDPDAPKTPTHRGQFVSFLVGVITIVVLCGWVSLSPCGCHFGRFWSHLTVTWPRVCVIVTEVGDLWGNLAVLGHWSKYYEDALLVLCYWINETGRPYVVRCETWGSACTVVTHMLWVTALELQLTYIAPAPWAVFHIIHPRRLPTSSQSDSEIGVDERVQIFFTITLQACVALLFCRTCQLGSSLWCMYSETWHIPTSTEQFDFSECKVDELLLARLLSVSGNCQSTFEQWSMIRCSRYKLEMVQPLIHNSSMQFLDIHISVFES